MDATSKLETTKRPGPAAKEFDLKAADTRPRKSATRRKLDSNSLQTSLGYSLRRAQISTFKEFEDAMDPEGVRPSQYAVLVLIRFNPGLSQAAVSRALDIQKANLVTLLDGLERRGWTERRTVPGDRRASALYLTRPGEAFVRKLEAKHQEMEARLTQRLGSARSAQLLKLLQDFCAARPEPSTPQK